MRQLVKNYIFDKTAKTITFTDFASGVDHERPVTLLRNVTRSKIIYQFNSTALGGSVSSNVVSLATIPAQWLIPTKLQIIYDYDYVAPGEDITTNSLRTRASAATSAVRLAPTTATSCLVPTFRHTSGGSIQLSGNHGNHKTSKDLTKL